MSCNNQQRNGCRTPCLKPSCGRPQLPFPCPLGCKGATGATGSGGAGATGATGVGITGATGAGGAGSTGATGLTGITGYAEFLQTVQAPNDSVPPGQAFSFNTTVFNTLGITLSPGPGAIGTAFTFSTAGVYVFDYEMSLASAGSVALFIGPAVGSLNIDTNTVAGSSTATTRIHGRAIENLPSGEVVIVSSVVGTAAVVTAGTDAGNFMIRLTILKIA
jgi:hypothetical protein